MWRKDCVVDRRAAKGQLRDKGHWEHREAGALGIRRGGQQPGAQGRSARPLGRPERQTGRPHGLQH